MAKKLTYKTLHLDALDPFNPPIRPGKSTRNVLQDYPIDEHGLSYGYYAFGETPQKQIVGLTIRQNTASATASAALRKMADFIDRFGTDFLDGSIDKAPHGIGNLIHSENGLTPDYEKPGFFDDGDTEEGIAAREYLVARRLTAAAFRAA